LTLKKFYDTIIIKRDRGEKYMAKLAVSKLGLKVNNQVVNIHYNDQIIEVKQYISVNDKLKLISEVINNTIDEHSFCNPVKVQVYLALGILDYYTNISFTEKQREDPVKLYDNFQSTKLLHQICNTIPEEELIDLTDGIWDSINSIYTYNNSAMGVIENIGSNYKDMNLDVEEIQQKLANGENVEFLKEILDKLG
jgi:hypothetical protein